ncbi:hypothetical protein SKAU_G00028810 [Synaphobranchus kaupii]|uniref:Uncharacterized protein n=1 Tax=Synaphobranchus kaupii TaxID=118154 RepID=A0A9Q1GE92_SYNKA|nr:hypothetical protein SKAU_G00028810 [Synaphobranchus kaupii]
MKGRPAGAGPRALPVNQQQPGLGLREREPRRPLIQSGLARRLELFMLRLTGESFFLRFYFMVCLAYGQECLERERFGGRRSPVLRRRLFEGAEKCSGQAFLRSPCLRGPERAVRRRCGSDGPRRKPLEPQDVPRPLLYDGGCLWSYKRAGRRVFVDSGAGFERKLAEAECQKPESPWIPEDQASEKREAQRLDRPDKSPGRAGVTLPAWITACWRDAADYHCYSTAESFTREESCRLEGMSLSETMRDEEGRVGPLSGSFISVRSVLKPGGGPAETWGDIGTTATTTPDLPSS